MLLHFHLLIYCLSKYLLKTVSVMYNRDKRVKKTVPTLKKLLDWMTATLDLVIGPQIFQLVAARDTEHLRFMSSFAFFINVTPIAHKIHIFVGRI